MNEDNNHILISVKDTGSGIDPEILPELFSKFKAKSFSGTGLGLFISKSIVEAHGGRIWAEKNSDGKGTTFTFSLYGYRWLHPQVIRSTAYNGLSWDKLLLHLSRRLLLYPNTYLRSLSYLRSL